MVQEIYFGIGGQEFNSGIGLKMWLRIYFSSTWLGGRVQLISKKKDQGFNITKKKVQGFYLSKKTGSRFYISKKKSSRILYFNKKMGLSLGSRAYIFKKKGGGLGSRFHISKKRERAWVQAYMFKNYVEEK
eukprot:snap_masked-scaffold_95-processed-gene-0.4-mRNA-1 protein AED:1.00 eAED:1.00 QI:0/0/0/0/1/1/2/0/130